MTWLSASSLSTPCTAKKTFEATIEAQAQVVSAAGKPLMAETSVTQGRNRHETRAIAVFELAWGGNETEWKPLVKQIIQVTRTVLQRSAKTGLWTSSSEVAYYVASAPLIAPQLAAIRNHWDIENKLHYTRDVTFQEDNSCIRTNPGIFARLRSSAYNILRCNKTESFNQTRFAAALGSLVVLGKWILS